MEWSALCAWATKSKQFAKVNYINTIRTNALYFPWYEALTAAIQWQEVDDPSDINIGIGYWYQQNPIVLGFGYQVIFW